MAGLAATMTTPKHGQEEDIHGNIPPTPHHGEEWRPFSPRRSTRVAAKKSKEPTQHLAPDGKKQHHLDGRKRRASITGERALGRPGKGSFPLESDKTDPKTSPGTPRRRRKSALQRGRSPSGSESGGSDSDGHGFSAKPSQSASANAVKDPFSMLPTPAKTPRKKTIPKDSMNSASRTLFTTRLLSPSDAMPTKKSRKPKGYEIFEDSPAPANQFEVYEDSRERIPAVDDDADNPFISRPGEEEAIVREEVAYQRRKATRATSKDAQIEDEAAAGNGMIFTL
jgi:hypothetical protein